MHPQPLALLENLRGVLQEARLASQKEVRENAHQMEDAVRRHQEKRITDAELLAEIDVLREKMRLVLKEHQVKHGGRMDRRTLGLLEALREKLLAKMSGGASLLVFLQDVAPALMG